MSDLILIAQKLRSIIEKAVSFLDDKDALEAKTLFHHWTAGEVYEKDVRVFFDGKLYRCLQQHTSQENLKPTLASELWNEVSIL